MGSEEAPESEVSGMSFKETELTLGLPGEGRPPVKCSTKRWIAETVVVCKSGAGESPPAMAQVVGWPPVRSSRNKAANERFKYVKVSMDGAPYLRKVNLQAYSNYRDLFQDLDKLFNCSTIGANGEENKHMEYVTTYEDKDSDWMLVGDVPWKMFMDSCKRIRLMKFSEAAVLNLESRGSSTSK